MVLAKALLPNMIAKREGAVINIGSVSGKTGEANGAAYSASKFGLIGFTQSLYEEVREHGIKVAVILPGFVDTPLIPPNRQLDRANDSSRRYRQTFFLFCVADNCRRGITVRPQNPFDNQREIRRKLQGKTDRSPTLTTCLAFVTALPGGNYYRRHAI
jgi:NAD(P)-dependent dehydrogenase (short-subunit alcohol dehydrogenase family)